MEFGSSLSQELSLTTYNKPRSIELRIAAVRASRILSASEVCNRFKIGRRTLFRWKKQWKDSHDLNPKKIPGCPQKLAKKEVEHMLQLYKETPSITNQQVVHAMQNKIKRSSVSNYRKRANFSRKVIADEAENYASSERISEVRAFCEAIRGIPMSRRVYMDESFIYDNEGLKKGYSIRGQRILRSRPRHGRRWTLYLAIRQNGFVHPPILNVETADDLNFYHYAWEFLLPNLKPGETVIWDRLGKAGRCKNPTKQHYNPQIRQMIEGKGCKVLFLPPKGKYFNPIELVFGTIKTNLRHLYGNTIACTEYRARNEEELKHDLELACSGLQDTDFTGYFRERGSERGFCRAYPDIML
jgi:transposase